MWEDFLCTKPGYCRRQLAFSGDTMYCKPVCVGTTLSMLFLPRNFRSSVKGRTIIIQYNIDFITLPDIHVVMSMRLDSHEVDCELVLVLMTSKSNGYCHQ